MTFPEESVLAAFPPSLTAGNVVLGPLTIRQAVQLSRDGIDTEKAIPRDRIFDAAFVLSGERDRRRFLKRAKCGLRELANAVETVLNQAFETYIKPAKVPGAPETLTPRGLGWALEVSEAMCAEYGWTWQAALDTPVATAWALVAAARQRHGGKNEGFDFEERRYQRDLKAGRRKGLKL